MGGCPDRLAAKYLDSQAVVIGHLEYLCYVGNRIVKVVPVASTLEASIVPP